ncbi:Hypothetical predicted protein [Cloeon dipterum]|uniref:C2H2-type domain-containing protein n=1 Tax=Cloeon dipterum TaxID=197152 RepID=A0A8S1CR37_9INSE|nr:Hypothetical predicted protein [Cloeon dipterum]
MLEQILPRLQFWQITSNPQAKGRKGTIGVDEDHSDSTKTGDEMPEQRDIPPELSGRDGRMPRDFLNPAVQVHSPKRSRMEGRARGVGIAQPSTSGGSIDLNLPGTLFGSNRPTIQDLIPLFLNLFRKQRILQQFRMQQLLQHGHSYPQAQAAYDLPGTSFGSKRPSFQDLIPVYENILKSQRILVKILPQLQLQQGISNPQAREVVPAAPEHPSGSRSQGYEQLNREDNRECPREDHMNKAENENRYHCPVCGKSYRNKGEARVHEIGHKNRKTD